MASINASTGQIGQTNYCASKAGILGFTKALALENATKGITVNAIAPGYVETDMVTKIDATILQHIVDSIPVKRLGQGDEIARCALFLASEESSYITGTTLHINGGKFMG
jgi:acetoacetyl-CoA reductase